MRGTDIHNLAVKLQAGEEVDVPEPLLGHVDAYLAFTKEWQPQEYLVEVVVLNRRYRYMGTLDLVAELATGNSGCWTGRPARPASSPRAPCSSPPTRTPSTTSAPTAQNNPCRRSTGAGVCGSAPTATTSSPSPTPTDTFRTFLYAQQVARFAKAPREVYVHEALTPPHVQEVSRMTVVPYESRAWLTLQNPALELANAIAATDFVPTTLRGNPAAITAAILYGDEVGLGPMQSLAKIAVINGRPTLAAETQRALILQAGHDIWIEDSTNTKCTVAGRRQRLRRDLAG